MIKGLNRYGAYILEQKHLNTRGLEVFKSDEMTPLEKFEWFLNKLNPTETNVEGWLKFEHDDNIYFIKKKELYTILLTLSNGGTVYYWGEFGTGKTVVATALMKKLFGRVVVFRMLRNMTPVELFGQYDPIAVHLTVNLMKDHIKQEVIKKYSKGETQDFTNIPLEEALKLLPPAIQKVKQVNFQFSNIGKALEENSALLIDEVDKVTDYELTPLSSITQDKNKYLPIPDFGALEFNQPVILLGNSKDINKFIKTRVIRVKREHLPVELFKELLSHEKITDPIIIEKMVELYKYVESGELTIRDLINTAKNLQTFYQTSKDIIDPSIEEALIPQV